MSSSLPPIMTLNNKTTNHSSSITFMCGGSSTNSSHQNEDDSSQHGRPLMYSYNTTDGTKSQHRQEHYFFRRANAYFTHFSSPPGSPVKQQHVKPPPPLAFTLLNKDASSSLSHHVTGAFGQSKAPTTNGTSTSTTQHSFLLPTERSATTVNHGINSNHGQHHVQEQQYSSSISGRKTLLIPFSSGRRGHGTGAILVVVVVVLTSLVTFTTMIHNNSSSSLWMEGEDYYYSNNYQQNNPTNMMYTTTNTMDHSPHGQLLRNERDLIERQHEQQQEVDPSLSSLTSNGDQMVTFSFEDCVGVSVPTCQTIVKNQLSKEDIWKNVRVQFNVLDSSSSSDHVFGTEPQDIFIQVNSLGQVLSGGKTSQLSNNMDSGSAPPTGFVGFDIELPEEVHHHGQPCYTKSYDHCCRNVQRSYQRFIRIEEVNHDRHFYQRIEEDIDATDVTVWDSHCMLEPILPKTTVYVSSSNGEVQLEEVVLEEYIYNESTQTFDLIQNTIDPNDRKVVITLNVQTAATIGYHSVLGVVVSQSPTWMVRVIEVKPQDVLENRNDPSLLLQVSSQEEEPSTSKAIDYYLSQHDAMSTSKEEKQHEHRSGMLGEMEMLERTIAPPSTAVDSTSTTPGSIWLAMSESWRYSLPMAIAIATLCACCGFLMFMCCIPVSSLEDNDDNESNNSNDSSSAVVGKLGNNTTHRNKKRQQSHEKASSSTTLEDEYDEDEYYHDNINGGCYPDEDLCHSDDDTEVAHHPGKDYLRHSLVGKHHHYYGGRHRL